MVFAHELSWSTSRARNFASCARRYYYDYYLSWLGWDRDAAPERRKAYLLKKMSRLPMLAGDLVHQAIAEFFAHRGQGTEYTAEDAQHWVVQTLRSKYKESRDGAWKARPAKLCRLAEHHYEEERIDEGSGAAGEYGKRYVQRMRDCLETFFTATSLAEARQSEPESWLACEEMSTFELFDTKIYAVPDFAYRSEDGRVHILDWKTGKPRPEDRFQLEVYAFYAREHWDVAVEDIVCADVYLQDGETQELRLTTEELDLALGKIEASLAGMRELHFDAGRGPGDAARFELIPEGSPEAFTCGSCNYREMCDRA